MSCNNLITYDIFLNNVDYNLKFPKLTLEKNLNFLIQYSCRIDDCPLALLTFIKFPEVQDRAYFPSQFPAHVLEF